MKDRGVFITLEGGEGAGKSTNIETIRAHLAACGLDVLVTREPGGTPLGEALRSILLSHEYNGMHSDSELLLMFAARAEHLQKVIEPALSAGRWVLCDRFTDATYAYQGGGRGISRERIAALEDWVQGGLRPDCVILLDIDPQQGLARAKGRSDADRFEREAIDFFSRVRRAYLERAADDPERYRVVDASRPLDAIALELRAILDELSNP